MTADDRVAVGSFRPTRYHCQVVKVDALGNRRVCGKESMVAIIGAGDIVRGPCCDADARALLGDGPRSDDKPLSEVHIPNRIVTARPASVEAALSEDGPAYSGRRVSLRG